MTAVIPSLFFCGSTDSRRNFQLLDGEERLGSCSGEEELLSGGTALGGKSDLAGQLSFSDVGFSSNPLSFPVVTGLLDKSLSPDFFQNNLDFLALADCHDLCIFYFF